MVSSTTERAIALIRRGFSIFPVAGKRPLTDDGFYSATSSAEKAAALFDARPDATGIGVRTGAGILVLDVDPRNGGFDSFRALEAERGELPATFTVATGGGGLHLYFRAPADAGPWHKKIGAGLDIKADGGYVVGAGSMHESGATYSVDVDAPVADAPAWLLALARKPAPGVSAPSAPAPTRGTSILDEPIARARAVAVVAAHVPPLGRRHEFALVLGGVLHGQTRLDADRAAAFAREAFALAGGSDPEARGRDVADTFARGATGMAITGIPSLVEFVGEAVADAILAAISDVRRANERFAAALQKDATAPAIEVRDIHIGPDQHRVIDEAINALAHAPEIYSRGGELVEVIEDDPNVDGLKRSAPIARIGPCAEPRVSDLLSRVARFWGASGADDKPRRVLPPQWAVRGVRARGQWPGIRPIVGVVTAPTMRHDGSILDSPGYDRATGLFLAPSIGVDVPAAPTRDDALAGVAALLDLVGQFDFAAEMHKSAWLAGLLGVVARPAIDGPVPMILVDASTRGSGKSLLCDAISVISTGRPAARMTNPPSDEEMRKRITALALAGDALVLLDNVVGELGCASLDAALTGTTWRDRVLGVSQMTAELPLRLCWLATANNAIIRGDLERRALVVRLEPAVERPEERSGWKYHPLLDHALRRRAELLGAALTIVRAYVVAGRPGAGKRTLGGFEAWSALVRGALVWLEQSDPCGTMVELRAADTTLDALRQMIAAWPAEDGKPVTARELIGEKLKSDRWRDALCAWCPPRPGALTPDARQLGYALRAVRRRVIGVHRVDSVSGKDGSAWIRSRVGG